MDREFDLADAIKQCADQKPEACRELYEREAHKLLGIAMRIVRRRDLAEDVVHDVFVQVWRKAEMFDPARGSARAWLYTMTRNRALNMIRDGGRNVGLDKDAHERVPDCADDPAAILERIDETSALRRCLENLDEMKRTSILLAYVDGFAQSAIAERLNVPLNTAKAWIRRGLEALRDCMR